jgi:succinylglutamate desuccinylase
MKDEDELFIIAAYADDLEVDDLKRFRLIQEVTTLKNEIRHMMKASVPNFELIKRYQTHIKEMETELKVIQSKPQKKN